MSRSEYGTIEQQTGNLTAEAGNLTAEEKPYSTTWGIARFVFYMASLAGIAYFMAWTLINNAGPLMLTVGNMDDCGSGSSGSISDGKDTGVYTISCPQLKALDPQQNWPANPIYGCIDGVNYQRTVQSLLGNRCTPELMANCATILANAFFSGSRKIPYSKFGEFVNAYGVFCEKDTSSMIGVAFIVAAAAALIMLARVSVIVSHLWAQKNKQTIPSGSGANEQLNVQTVV